MPGKLTLLQAQLVNAHSFTVVMQPQTVSKCYYTRCTPRLPPRRQRLAVSVSTQLFREPHDGRGVEVACQANTAPTSSTANSDGSLTRKAGNAQQAPDSSKELLAVPDPSNATQQLAPARRKTAKRTQELDVSRAVQLLKLTATRNDKNKLPVWFTRTLDPEYTSGSSEAETWDDNVLGSSSEPDDSSRASSNGRASSSSKQSSNAQGASRNNSVWQRQEQGTAASTSRNSATNSNSRSRRMFSASDPIRHSSSGHEWHFPWQDYETTDAAKEHERQFRRAVFSFDRWAAHRSTARYARHFRGIFSSRTFQGLLQPMAFFAGMAVVAGLYNSYAVPAGGPDIKVNDSALNITAFAVSLLLVFRTDSSYARWEEALKAWNEIRSLSKDLARQACYWVSNTAVKQMLVRWCEAFSRALLVHCRADGCLDSELVDVLEPHEVAAVAAVGPSGAPSFVLQVIVELVEQCRVSEAKESAMFSTVRGLGDAAAVCNKLLRYPLPLAYTRHTSRFMFLWLSAMPWAMWSELHWMVVPLTAAIAYLLLGIDEIGVQIEEPFGILPLEDVCIDIQAEIDAMMERQDIVTDLLTAGGVHCEPRSTCGACGSPLQTVLGIDSADSAEVELSVPSVPAAVAAATAREPQNQQDDGGAAAATALLLNSQSATASSVQTIPQEDAMTHPKPIHVQQQVSVASGSFLGNNSGAVANGWIHHQHDVATLQQHNGRPGTSNSSFAGSHNNSTNCMMAWSTSSHANSSSGTDSSEDCGFVAAGAPFASAGLDIDSHSVSVPDSSSSSTRKVQSTNGRAADNDTASNSSSSRRTTPAPDSLIARWIINTTSKEDPLSSLEDAPGPAFYQLTETEIQQLQLQQQQQRLSSNSSGSSSINSHGSIQQQRQPATVDHFRYPD